MLHVIPDELFNQIRSHICDDNSTVIVSESTMKKIQDEHKLDSGELDGHASNYDHGGEADFWIDVVFSDQHHFIQDFPEKKNNQHESQEGGNRE